MHHKQTGFTLIEVMITVAIVAILATIAYPSYADYVRRGKIAEATTTMQDFRVKMEQYFLDNRKYDNAGACGVAAPTMKYFTYACAITATGYQMTATGAAGQGMGGFTYTINETNQRATTALPAGWTVTANCWVLKKDGSC